MADGFEFDFDEMDSSINIPEERRDEFYEALHGIVEDCDNIPGLPSDRDSDEEYEVALFDENMFDDDSVDEEEAIMLSNLGFAEEYSSLNDETENVALDGLDFEQSFNTVQDTVSDNASDDYGDSLDNFEFDDEEDREAFLRGYESVFGDSLNADDFDWSVYGDKDDPEIVDFNNHFEERMEEESRRIDEEYENEPTPSHWRD